MKIRDVILITVFFSLLLAFNTVTLAQKNPDNSGAVLVMPNADTDTAKNNEADLTSSDAAIVPEQESEPPLEPEATVEAVELDQQEQSQEPQQFTEEPQQIPSVSSNQPQQQITLSPPTNPSKITLDIKGMDIIDVLKMFASRYNMNIVVGKNVSGRVTLFLKDVDVQEALQIVLLSNELAYERQGEIINIMTQRDYELKNGERFQDKKQAKTIKLNYAKAVDLSRALNQIKTNIGRVIVDEGSNTLVVVDTPDRMASILDFIKSADIPTRTKVYNLSYAQADKLSPKIQEILTKGIGSLRIDERTNKIAVTDYPAKLQELDKIILAFDEKSPQVVIDAQIIEISPTDAFSMGVDWDYWIQNHARFITPMPAPAIVNGITAANKLMIGTAAAGDEVNSIKQYKGIIDVLRIIGETKIISSPRLMVMNNQEAKILVGTKEAYITSAITSTAADNVTSQTVNFVDVGIKLYVTPTINKDGFVTMKIKPEVSSSETKELTADDKITQVPIVTTSETETTVTIKDGVTIIIAGLKKDNRAKEVRKIPWIGDIPGFGFLFRSTKDEVRKNELVIFLTPHIVTGEEPVGYKSLTRNQEISSIMALAEYEHHQQSNDRDSLSVDNYVKNIISRIKKVSAIEPGSKKFLAKGKVEMTFVIDSGGKLIGEPRVVVSDNNPLALIAVEGIKKASPFPPFPKTLAKSQQGFHVLLEYR